VPSPDDTSLLSPTDKRWQKASKAACEVPIKPMALPGTVAFSTEGDKGFRAS
jgi:hypothetical protein